MARLDQGEAVGLVQLGADLGQQLVGRHRDRAGEAGGGPHTFLDGAGNRARLAGQFGRVDVDLIDATVFDGRRDFRDGGLEQARVGAVFVEVERQRQGMRAPADRRPGLYAPVGDLFGGKVSAG